MIVISAFVVSSNSFNFVNTMCILYTSGYVKECTLTRHCLTKCALESKLLNQNEWSWYHFSQEKIPNQLIPVIVYFCLYILWEVCHSISTGPPSIYNTCTKIFIDIDKTIESSPSQLCSSTSNKQWLCSHELESRSERRFRTWFGPFLLWKPDFKPMWTQSCFKSGFWNAKKLRFGSWSA